VKEKEKEEVQETSVKAQPDGQATSTEELKQLLDEERYSHLGVVCACHLSVNGDELRTNLPYIDGN
jgi:hypothetical protein